jgi:hypothetical protein
MGRTMRSREPEGGQTSQGNLLPAKGLPRYARWRRGCRAMRYGLGSEADGWTRIVTSGECMRVALYEGASLQPGSAVFLGLFPSLRLSLTLRLCSDSGRRGLETPFRGLPA